MSPARLLGYAFAVVGGLAAGLLGSFAHGYTSYGVPWGLLAALGLLFGVLVTAGLLTRSRAGVLVTAAGWLLVVLVLSQPRPEGDLIVPGTSLGIAWLLGGMVTVGVALSHPYAGDPRAPRAAPPSGDAAAGR